MHLSIGKMLTSSAHKHKCILHKHDELCKTRILCDPTCHGRIQHSLPAMPHKHACGKLPLHEFCPSKEFERAKQKLQDYVNMPMASWTALSFFAPDPDLSVDEDAPVDSEPAMSRDLFASKKA